MLCWQLMKEIHCQSDSFGHPITPTRLSYFNYNNLNQLIIDVQVPAENDEVNLRISLLTAKFSRKNLTAELC